MAKQQNTGQDQNQQRNARPPQSDAERQGGGPDDLERNPGIGASKGATIAGADADEVDDLFADGDNTFPGDVENDAGRPGTGVDPDRRGRENQ